MRTVGEKTEYSRESCKAQTRKDMKKMERMPENLENGKLENEILYSTFIQCLL
jgi:hypothetical protein